MRKLAPKCLYFKLEMKGVKYIVTEDMTLSGGHTTQYTDDVS